MLALELGGIFLGVLARAFFPWLRKLRSGKAVRFSRRYFYSAISSVIAGMIVTVLIFPKFEGGACTLETVPVISRESP